MGGIVHYGKTAWRWVGHISLAQWLWSALGGFVMSVLAWIGGQPLWLVVFIGLVVSAIITFIWSQIQIGKAAKGNLMVEKPNPGAFSPPHDVGREISFYTPKAAASFTDVENSTLENLDASGDFEQGIVFTRSRGVTVRGAKIVIRGPRSKPDESAIETDP